MPEGHKSKRTEETQTAQPPPWPMNWDYVLALLAAWLVPGAGHWLLGYRVRAILLGGAVLGIFWYGQYLSDFRAVNRSIHPIFFWAQAGNGLSTILSNKLWAKRPKSTGVLSSVDRSLPAHLNTGILFTCVSGLLNAILLLYVADPRTWADRDGAIRFGKREKGFT